MLLSMHMTSFLFLVLFNNFARLWASIGVTRSYSSHPFLCALAMHIASIGPWFLGNSLHLALAHYLHLSNNTPV